jgi:hypothetical protein
MRPHGSPPLFPQFHHVPLYLEWAPVGVFSSTAPQKKEPQDTPAEAAEGDKGEQETGKVLSVQSGHPENQQLSESWIAEADTAFLNVVHQNWAQPLVGSFLSCLLEVGEKET